MPPSETDEVVAKIDALKQSMMENPDFQEWLPGQGHDDAAQREQRLQEQDRRQAKMRELHGLRADQDVKDPSFGREFETLRENQEQQDPSSTTADDPNSMPASTSAFAAPVSSSSSSSASQSRRAEQDGDLGMTRDHGPSAQSPQVAMPSASASSSSASSEPRLTESSKEWDSTDDQFFLVHLTHRGQRPLSKRPALRVLSSHATREEAVEEGMAIQRHKDLCNYNVWLFEKHVPQPICEKWQLQADPAYTTKVVQDIQALHDAHTLARTQEFKANVDEKKTGEQNLSVERKMLKLKETRKTHPRVQCRNKMMQDRKARDKLVSSSNDKYPRELEVRNQNFVAIRIVHDIRKQVLECLKEDEPVIIIDGVFETEAGVKQWIENVGAQNVLHEVLEGVDMYQWLHPADVDTKKVPMKYRDAELNTIMQAKESEAGRLSKFERWQAAQAELKALEAKVPKAEPTPEEAAAATATPEQQVSVPVVDDSASSSSAAVELSTAPFGRPVGTEEPVEALNSNIGIAS
jgi:hypothetical protein